MNREIFAGQNIKIACLAVAGVFLLSGCGREGWLGRLDDKLGAAIGKMEELKAQYRAGRDNGEARLDLSGLNIGTGTAAMIAEKLTLEEKVKIDAWLTLHKLNRYGDAEDIVYPGGTPLFDEATGETKERFQYILENHPELIIRYGLIKNLTDKAGEASDGGEEL